MRTFAELGQAIANVFLNFHWTFVLEGILFFLLIFFVCKVLYENVAKRFIFVYIGVVLVLAVITAFSKSEISTLIFITSLLIVSLFILLLFSVEIKRSVWAVGKSSESPVEKSIPKTKLGMHAEECIAAIIKAVQNLSKSDTGALIVLSNGNLPKEIVESGVVLNSTISSQLIEGIFIPKAPLHDGAMIIFGDKIQAAGCFLPLTQKEFPKEFGTRHRAGIGVTEVADVMTIIVSEETGIVSVVKHGSIRRYVDSDALKNFLHEYYWKEFNAEGKRS